MSDEHVAASRQRLSRRQSLRPAGLARGRGEVHDARRGERRVHQGDGLHPQRRLVTERRLQGELRQVDDGEHGLVEGLKG